MSLPLLKLGFYSLASGRADEGRVIKALHKQSTGILKLATDEGGKVECGISSLKDSVLGLFFIKQAINRKGGKSTLTNLGFTSFYVKPLILKRNPLGRRLGNLGFKGVFVKTGLRACLNFIFALQTAIKRTCGSVFLVIFASKPEI
ncbi:hypothetical protein [Rufibacter sp. XAAS-G3-1]|uniref:hypothetical protein n=1 Tax=Rufibacter sp. XAAS-G3-1 TaxID=2729134 RepID=UPI0015E79FBB|nr:hypothetical protein [Rufibacter sp. XAAS-G3-1]